MKRERDQNVTLNAIGYQQNTAQQKDGRLKDDNIKKKEETAEVSDIVATTGNKEKLIGHDESSGRLAGLDNTTRLLEFDQ